MGKYMPNIFLLLCEEGSNPEFLIGKSRKISKNRLQFCKVPQVMAWLFQTDGMESNYRE